MGKHSAGNPFFTPPRKPRSNRPSEISHLGPSSTSYETQAEAQRRRRDAGRPLVDQNARRRKIVRIVGGILTSIVLLTVMAIAAAALTVNGWVGKANRDSKTVLSVLDKPPAAKPDQPKPPFYMLLMGIDQRPGEKFARSDTLILARVDPGKKRVTLISIPRDTRAQIPGHGRQKINAAAALGGPKLAVQTVKELTGLPISHYAIVNFYGFKQLVDALGGVYVDVPQHIYDIRAANHSREYAEIEEGYQKLDGAHALTFVRSRKYAEGDLKRIESQQLFFKAVLRQTMKTSVFRWPKVGDALADHVTTDMNISEVLGMANDLRGMKESSLETVKVPGGPKYINGASYVVTDEEAFEELIERIDRGMSAEDAAQDATLSAPSYSPSDVTVTVKNGAGIAGVAKDAKDKLLNGGYEVPTTGNMNQFVYDRTLVVYKKNEAKATLVRGFLGRGDVVKSSGMYAFNTDILVVVGKDWKKSSAGNTLPVGGYER